METARQTAQWALSESNKTGTDLSVKDAERVITAAILKDRANISKEIENLIAASRSLQDDLERLGVNPTLQAVSSGGVVMADKILEIIFRNTIRSI